MSNHNHHDHDHDHNHEEFSETIVLTDEEGNETEFDIIASLEVNDVEYAILAEPDSEDTVLIFKVHEMENGEFDFEGVTDEDEAQDVIQSFYELLDEEENQ